ncbi:MAG: class I SAM-dependent methyltransferase [Nitrospiraceae bacterium]|nr:class I SAM-dependent methyltransferase [Nitrospiraceae bacterium]
MTEFDRRAVLAEEEAFHDRMIYGHDSRGGYFYDWGLSAEAVGHARSLLGRVNGKQILECGCGTGDEALRLALAGASVTAIDISAGMVKVTNSRAKALGLDGSVKAVKMNVEALDFPAGTFDIVYGISVIHHLLIEEAAPRILNVLKKPSGKAVFVEPLAYNPVINIFRALTPGRRSKTEQPLSFEQIRRLGSGFRRVSTKQFGLTSILAAGIPFRSAFTAALVAGNRIDRLLLKTFPSLGRYCWISVIEMEK